MVKMYYDSDCNLGVLYGKTVAIIGFGSQGHAHAENLHDSGVNVVVGLRPGSKHEKKAKDAGLTVMTPYDAAAAEIFLHGLRVVQHYESGGKIVCNTAYGQYRHPGAGAGISNSPPEPEE